MVLENQPFSQVLVRIDGSRGATTMNRRFVKVITPPIRQVGANYDAQLSDRTSDEDSDDDDDYYQPVQQPLQQLSVTQQGDGHDDVIVQDAIASNEQGQPPQQQHRQESEVEEPLIPQPPPHVQGPPHDPEVGGGLQRDQLPEDLHPLHDGAGSPLPPAVGNTRLCRNTRPPDR